MGTLFGLVAVLAANGHRGSPGSTGATAGDMDERRTDGGTSRGKAACT